MRFLLLTLLILGCSRHEAKPTVGTLDDVLNKAEFYQSKLQYDEFGWLDFTCDGLLFNSLAAYSGVDINIHLAETDPGHWFRRPNPERCRVISKDMFRGLFIYLFDRSDLESLVHIYAYGEAHNWFMGESEIPEEQFGRALMSPQMQYQLKRIIQNLSGDTIDPPLDFPPDAKAKESYPGHLEVLNIWNDYLIDGYLKSGAVALLQKYAESNEKNALFNALYHTFKDGNQEQAISTLLDESFFPSDRLPDNTNYCAHYLWERSFDEQDKAGNYFWQPCGQLSSHSPVDYLLAVKILKKVIY